MKLQPADIQSHKGKQPLAMLTAYSAPMGNILEEAGVPLVLVGDSLGMVELGQDSTREVSMGDICHHIRAVRRGASKTHIIGDMPYGSDVDSEAALANAQALIGAGSDSVKLEGAQVDQIKTLVSHGIPVVGHTGLLPQTATNFRQVGKDAQDAERIILEAQAIQDAGCFLIVLEHMPDDLSRTITQTLTIPTIGIGAGNSCDGQVLVLNDMLGLSDRCPPFVKQYANIRSLVRDAASTYVREVEERSFPDHG